MATEAGTWVGRALIGNDGSRLGEIAEVFTDDDGEGWLTVRTGRTGSDMRVVPVRGTTVRGVRDIVTWLDQADLARAPAPGRQPEPERQPAPRRTVTGAPPRTAPTGRPPRPSRPAPSAAAPAPAPVPAPARRAAPRPAASAAAAGPARRRRPPADPDSPASSTAHPRRRPGTNLTEIVGLGPDDAATLVGAGVRNIAALLDECGSAAGRRAVAKATGIATATILEWVNRADLMRIHGVGAEYSDLLESSGVDTVRELSKRNPANLQARMAEVNDELHLVGRTPSLTEVQRWADEAKDLPVAVTY